MFLTKKEAYKKMAKKGFFDMLPLNLAVIPWGILCGSLAIARGFTWFEALLMPVIVFAGSVQLVVVELMYNNSSLITILFTAFIISSRHFLYGLTLRDKIKDLPSKWRLSYGFLLTDEFFAISSHPKSFNGKLRLVYGLFAGGSFYLFWILWNLIGIILGSYLPDLTNMGLDFAIAVTFISLVIPAIKSIPMLVSVLLAGILSVTFNLYGWELALVCSSILSMGGGFVTYVFYNKKVPDDRDSKILIKEAV